MLNQLTTGQILTFLYDAVTVTAHSFGIIASGIAIYLFVAKRRALASLFQLLVNYSYQLTLSELKEKLEKLNDYNARDPEQYDQIVNIFNDILGQIRGNDRLRIHFSEIVGSIEVLLSDRKKLTEPRKRVLVSELRERIRHLNVRNIDELMGE